jgi:homoserine dehydrogenase
MTDEGRSFKEVLKEAQEKGYAEADPTYDVEGIDAAHKLAILIRLAYGTPLNFRDIFISGISEIMPLDIQFSREFGYRIKLLAIAKMDHGKIEARVHPTMIPEGHLLSTVHGVFNAIYIQGDAVGPTLFYGQGAGQMPTASAVVSDLVELGRNILIRASGRRVPLLSYQEAAIEKIPLKKMEDVVMPFYMRFSAVDRPRVLSRISGILGKNEISISSVIQKGRQVNGAVPVVMMTHEAREKNVHHALKEIDRLGVILGKTMYLRVENALGDLIDLRGNRRSMKTGFSTPMPMVILLCYPPSEVIRLKLAYEPFKPGLWITIFVDRDPESRRGGSDLSQP